MKVGDLVKRKRQGKDDLAIVVKVMKSGDYVYPKIMWLDTCELDSCSGTLLEVISKDGCTSD